ncbi:MAG: DUF2802 domain-containing protein [Pseudomonadota bacterium]
MAELTPVLALAALLLAALALLGLALLAMRLRQQWQQLERQQETMQSDLRALCNAAVQVGERVGRLEQGLKQVQQRQQELGSRQEQMVYAEPDERAYDQAVKLAQKGASLEEIMDICDLSRGEAELVTMMHRMERGQ